MIRYRKPAFVVLAFATALGWAAGASASPQPDAAARCIADHLPQGAHLFHARDGSIRVIAIGRRGSTARWTITGSAAALRIDRAGGPAGQDRLVAACY